MEFTKATACPPDLGPLVTPLEADGEPFTVAEADPWGQPYRLEREGARVFRICSDGPDGEPDTEDDIVYPDTVAD